MILRRLALIGIAALTYVTVAAAEPAENWQTAFPRESAAQQSIYFEARYLDASGIEHRQEVWREGARRLRRVTDGRLDLKVEQDTDGEYQYRLGDRARHIMILADRTSLYRIGIFSDWEGLAYGLSEPRRPYELATLGGALERSGIAPCAWTTMTMMTDSQSASRICWSSEWGAPISIQTKRGDDWVTQFAITEVRTFEPCDATFQIDGVGYVEIDARASDDLAD
ncbi:MAG: hypothetical protein QOH65_84 [Methylobacteriaceae bacterium]|nr:hypothetical protein [Methylobacteriaceae bacterium]